MVSVELVTLTMANHFTIHFLCKWFTPQDSDKEQQSSVRYTKCYVFNNTQVRIYREWYKKLQKGIWSAAGLWTFLLMTVKQPGTSIQITAQHNSSNTSFQTLKQQLCYISRRTCLISLLSAMVRTRGWSLRSYVLDEERSKNIFC